MTDYPILVERWTGEQALKIACGRCDAMRVIDPDEIYNEDIYECPADHELARTASTARRCRGTASMAYVEGERCRSCRRLDYSQPIDGCCSRKCALQAEYAASLATHGRSSQARGPASGGKDPPIS